MAKLICSEFTLGRRFIGRLPNGEDLIATIQAFCDDHSIQMATFSVIGAVSSVTLGTYDQRQHVYVTFTETSSLEIITCTGSVSLMDGSPFVHSHIVLGNKDGNVMGGHLFSETILFAGEIDLQELSGKPLERGYDDTTGLMLWNALT